MIYFLVKFLDFYKVLVAGALGLGGGRDPDGEGEDLLFDGVDDLTIKELIVGLDEDRGIKELIEGLGEDGDIVHFIIKFDDRSEERRR